MLLFYVQARHFSVLVDGFSQRWILTRRRRILQTSCSRFMIYTQKRLFSRIWEALQEVQMQNKYQSYHQKPRKRYLKPKKVRVWGQRSPMSGHRRPHRRPQGVSDTEPSSADSQASPKSVADNKKARCTVPPPLPAHAPKMQHYIAQDLQPPPRPPPGPPNMQHYLEQGIGSVWDEPEEPEPRPPEYLGQNYKICWNKQWHGLATLKVWHGLAEESERKKKV